MNQHQELLEELVKSNEVFICIPSGEYIEELVSLGCKLVSCNCLERQGTNPLKDLKLINYYRKTLKKYNQDIIEMKYYQMMSIEEIATKKDRGYGAIQKTIDRSIKIMQKEYNKNKMS